MKKLFLVSIMLITVLALASCSTSQADSTYLSVEINPEMEMVINQEMNVVSYSLGNEAAEIVAAGLNLVGMNYEEALKTYLNAAIATGYIDIDRNDNAIAFQAYNQNETTMNQFQLEVQTKLQDYIGENKLGVVLMNQGEVNTELQTLVDQYDITYGFARLVVAYVALDETRTIEEAVTMTPSELMNAVVDDQKTFMEQYRNQRQLDVQAVKDALEEALQSRVEAHHQAVLNGTISTPDTTGIKEQYLNDYEGIKEAFVLRNQERVQYANALINGVVNQLLVGTFNYEKSSKPLDYSVVTHEITLNSDQTYTESYQYTYTDETQNVNVTETGTWAVIEGKLVLTNSESVIKEFQIFGTRLIFENEDGIFMTLKKIIES